MQPGDVRETLSNTNKIYKLCGYKSKTDVPNGVKKFIKWYAGYFKKDSNFKIKDQILRFVKIRIIPRILVFSGIYLEKLKLIIKFKYF